MILKNGATVHAKAPGKVLLMGGYAVLEKPNLGFVITVDANAHAYITQREDYTVVLDSKQFGHAEGKVDKKTGRIEIDRCPKELVMLKTALELAMMYAVSLGAEVNGFNITTACDPAFSYAPKGSRAINKSGLGSSAAITVAAIGGVLTCLGMSVKKDDVLHKLSQAAHSIATGKVGSGFDIAAAVYGSVLYSRYSPEILESFPKDYTPEDVAALVKRKWDYEIRKVEIPRGFSLCFANILGGSTSTTEFVKRVREMKVNKPQKYAEITSVINSSTLKAIGALKKMQDDAEGNATDANIARFREAFNTGRLATKELGTLAGVEIEADHFGELIDVSMDNGALVAKLPGAGGKDAIAALCRTEDDRKRLVDFWKGTGELQPMDINQEEGGYSYNIEN